MKKIKLDELLTAMNDIEAFENSYNQNINQLTEDIMNRIADITIDCTLETDIDDLLTISEQKNYALGFYDGLKLLKNV